MDFRVVGLIRGRGSYEVIIFLIEDESQHLEMSHLSGEWKSLKMLVLSILYCISLMNFPSVSIHTS